VMANCLVLGGAGFVGRHLVRRLLERGDRVYVVDSIVPATGGINPDISGWPLYNPWSSQYRPRFYFHKEDCRTWFHYNYDQHFDYAFHLAAIVGGREMIENNPLAVADDLSIDAAYWQWALEAKPNKSVIFSSSAAYPIELQGEKFHRVLRENDILPSSPYIGMPDMTYGWAKLTVEYLARLAYEKYGLKSICFRPFSGYGEDQDISYPFPSICKRVVTSLLCDSIEVWGTGQQRRDFIYIDDCIDGVLTMMDQIDNGDAVNLSTGVGTSFNDLIWLVAAAERGERARSIAPMIRPLSDRPVGVFSRVGDTTKQRQLGFEAKTPLKDGVEKMVAYLTSLVQTTGERV
jgi:nucleoside-diphosphate-sugar epimerase